MVTIRDRFPSRLRTFSGITAPELVQAFREVRDTLGTLLPTSIFSFSTPESNVTATPGTLGLNLATQVGSAISALWVKTAGSGNTGWRPLG